MQLLRLLGGGVGVRLLLLAAAPVEQLQEQVLQVTAQLRRQVVREALVVGALPVLLERGDLGVGAEGQRLRQQQLVRAQPLARPVHHRGAELLGRHQGVNKHFRIVSACLAFNLLSQGALILFTIHLVNTIQLSLCASTHNIDQLRIVCTKSRAGLFDLLSIPVCYIIFHHLILFSQINDALLQLLHSLACVTVNLHILLGSHHPVSNVDACPVPHCYEQEVGFYVLVL
mmetsp:Transcript_6000/g.9713  ORF Transcript_6000/g.9713 Transcript_6000/m.9713 type:complete len:229 (+) Transcript_6000:1509-2195(+)